VIVVDNASTDESAMLAQRFDNVTCLELKHNLGFGRANNIGIREALDLGADYLFLLNQDAYIHANAMERLIDGANAHPEYGIVSPVHLNDAGTALDPFFEKCIERAGVADAAAMLDDVPLGNEPLTVPFVNAAAWLVSRECLQKVGGFDPIFFMYGEDDDLANRVKYHGFEIGVMPGSFIHHIRSSQPTGPKRKASINKIVESVLPRHIVNLKQPGTELSSDLMRFHKYSLSKLINSVRGIKLSRIAVTIMIWLKVMLRLPQLSKHKRICSVPGAHWLSDDMSKAQEV
jgi:GT2 family glycosyltransferase